jgi:hypothetical protein
VKGNFLSLENGNVFEISIANKKEVAFYIFMVRLFPFTSALFIWFSRL